MQSFAYSSDGRGLQGLTIDAPHSHVLDDAIWLSRAAQPQTLSVTVSISDVAAHIPQDMLLMHEAFRGPTTRPYALAKAWQRLPRVISGRKASLLPDAARPVIALNIALDVATLSVVNATVESGLLRPAARLSFPDVHAIISGARPSPYRQMLHDLAALAQRLLEQRRMPGSRSFTRRAKESCPSESGEPSLLDLYEHAIGQVIVQEVMILANRVAADIFVRAGIPAIYRNQVASDDQDLQARALGRAHYGTQPTGHSTLGVPAYVRVTSPLRRYADLVNLFNLKARLRKELFPFPATELRGQCQDLNDRAKVAKNPRTQRHLNKDVQDGATLLLQAPPDTMANLADKQFHTLVKALLDEDAPPKGFAEAFALRLGRGAVLPKTTYFVLFAMLDKPLWRDIRRQTLDWLRTQRHLAGSVLEIARSMLKLPPIHYQQRSFNDIYACQASVSFDSICIRSHEVLDGSKKGAQQEAAVSLCYAFCKEPYKQDREAFPQSADDVYQLFASSGPIHQLAEQGNYIGALTLLARRSGQPVPAWEYSTSQTGQSIQFHCRAVWRCNGRTFEGTGIGNRKKNAQHAAAAQIYRAIAIGLGLELAA